MQDKQGWPRWPMLWGWALQLWISYLTLRVTTRPKIIARICAHLAVFCCLPVFKFQYSYAGYCRNGITLHPASLGTAFTSEARLHLGDARTLGTIRGIGRHLLQYIYCYVKRINTQIRVSTGRMSHIGFCVQSQQGFGEAGPIWDEPVGFKRAF